MQSSASWLLYHEGSLRRQTREAVGSVPEILWVVNALFLVAVVLGHVITALLTNMISGAGLCIMQNGPGFTSTTEPGECGGVWRNWRNFTQQLEIFCGSFISFSF